MLGLIDGISNAEYHSSSAVGSSRLKSVLKCPALYHANPPFKATPAMDIGTVVHAMVLEPDTVLDIAVEAPVFKGKGSVAARAEFKEINEGKILLSAEDWLRCEAMTESLLALQGVPALLSQSKREWSGWYTDPETGIECRYRPDIRADWLIADVKTCQDASPGGFSRAIEKFGYHISAAHYLEGDSVLTGTGHNTFAFLCVESSAPYLAACYILGSESLAFGRWQRSKALNLIKACTSTGDWPGYNDGATTSIDVPRWAMREFNEGTL